MRFLLPLVALCALSSVSLRASDIFDITFTGSLSGSGTFTTDGTCSVCVDGGLGLLSLTINIGLDSGANAFDITDDLSSAQYIRGPNSFGFQGVNSETLDKLTTGLVGSNPNGWQLSLLFGLPLGSGTFTVTPAAAAPEPSSLFLLMPIVVILGVRRLRNQRNASGRA